MNFWNAVDTCFRKYAEFSGRARRSEYWYFCLFNTLVSCALSFLPGSLAFLSTIHALAILVPGLAVSWRRMHDIGKAGAWSLIALVPVVGLILVLIWNCRDSESGANEYGPNPKSLSGERI